MKIVSAIGQEISLRPQAEGILGGGGGNQQSSPLVGKLPLQQCLLEHAASKVCVSCSTTV